MTAILFTASETVLGRTIRDLTGEPVSHVAIRYGDYVLHSSVSGVDVVPWGKFARKSPVIYSVPVHIPDSLILSIISRWGKAPYDWRNLMYLFLRYAGRKYLHLPLPKANLWAASGMFTCTELVTHVLGGSPDSLVTPYGLYRRLTGN